MAQRKKPTEAEVKAEIQKLIEMKPTVLLRSGFGDDHHAAIDAQIVVLKEGLDNDDIYDRYGGNPEEGDEAPENILTAALEAMGWMDGGSYGDGTKPSEDWADLVRE